MAQIIRVEFLPAKDFVLVHLNDGTTEVLPTDSPLVQEYIKKKHD
jgi:hypothetical protein